MTEHYPADREGKEAQHQRAGANLKLQNGWTPAQNSPKTKKAILSDRPLSPA
jgi:hypothetical protein